MIEFARVLYGSQNYGLDGPDSDRDYKVLLCPTFEDFYRYHKVDKKDLPEECDPEHDSPVSVMRFHELLAQGNPNCVEMLFSLEWDVKVKEFGTYLDMARKVYGGGYVACVWDMFYSALTGLALNGMDRNGVTPKTVARARYLYGMAHCVAENGFVIDEGTYRSGDGEGAVDFHKLAKVIRFCPPAKAYLDECAETLRAAFSRDKEALSRKAKGFCTKNRMKMADMRASIDLLGMFVRDMVFMETQTDAMERLESMDYTKLGRGLVLDYLDREV